MSSIVCERVTQRTKYHEAALTTSLRMYHVIKLMKQDAKIQDYEVYFIVVGIVALLFWWFHI